MKPTPYHHGPWITTYTGKKFDFLSPRPEDVDIEDIAISLSRTTRFRGHTRLFYSVAQHSILVARLVPEEDKLWALLHDAAEAYLGDMPKPVKVHMGEEYRLVEARIMEAVAERFGLPLIEPESVKMADRILLVTEADELMEHNPEDWHLQLGARPDPNLIIAPVGEHTAYAAFMRSFDQLYHDS